MTSIGETPDTGSWHPKGFMILTPARIEVTAGDDFTSSVSVWPAGPRHTVSATAPTASALLVRVDGHKVTVSGRLDHPGETHTVVVTVRCATDVAHDTLTVEALPEPRAIR